MLPYLKKCYTMILDGVDETSVTTQFQRYACCRFNGDLFWSTMSRGHRSAFVLARWCKFGGRIDTSGSDLRPGVIKSQCRNISRISNQFPKIEFWFIPPKQPFGMVISKNDINKSPSALHLENFRKVRKFTKNTIFIHEISQNFERFQRNSTGAKKLLLTAYSSHV